MDIGLVQHILRNPFGWSESDQRKARLLAADVVGNQLGVEPDAFLFTVRYVGRGKSEQFAAIDFKPETGVEIIKKVPLYAVGA